MPPPTGYLVEAIVPPGPELLLGALRERYVATRLAPLSVEEAATMLDELPAAPRFRGLREPLATPR